MAEERNRGLKYNGKEKDILEPGGGEGNVESDYTGGERIRFARSSQPIEQDDTALGDLFILHRSG